MNDTTQPTLSAIELFMHFVEYTPSFIAYMCGFMFIIGSTFAVVSLICLLLLIIKNRLLEWIAKSDLKDVKKVLSCWLEE